MKKVPFRYTITGESNEPLEVQKKYAETCKAPRLSKQEPHGRKLAVVGGGPSVLNHLEELASWDGEIWGINNTASWLIGQGIRSTFLTVDPCIPEWFVTDGVEDALLSSSCHPELRHRFNSVQFFDIIELNEQGIAGGTTTATRAPSLGIYMGYYDISFFGCESSFPVDRDHVDRHENLRPTMIIRAGKNDYITTLELSMQAEVLSQLFLMAPKVFKDRSGGLSGAMVANKDTWEVAAVSSVLKEDLERINGKHGMYETPYTHLRTE